MDNIISIKDFMEDGMNDSDMTPVVFSALRKCKTVKNPVLLFPKGTYHFWPDKAFEKFYFMSNSDPILRKIVFPLLEMENMIIDGGGAEFIFHGRTLPFLLEGSKNITIRNISIDYKYTFYSCGKIMDSGYEFIDIKISKEDSPYRITGGRIQFYNEEWEAYPVEELNEIDSDTLTPAYQRGAEWIINPEDLAVEDMGDGVLRFKGAFAKLHKKGNWMAIFHEKRLNPAFAITNCSDIFIENVNIYHTGHMGILAQLTHNITIDKVNVILREGSSRIVSANADATHFIHCTGLITVQNCIFEHQNDDPLNVHGIYTLVSKIHSQDTIEVQFLHNQQNGVIHYSDGDQIRIVNKQTLQPHHVAVIKEVIPVNQRYMRIILDVESAGKISEGDVVENITKVPDIVIRGCRVGKNRARGFLITTPGNVLVENNVIYTSRAGIYISGGCDHWYESGPVKNVVIRNNEFIDCGYAPGERGIIDIRPALAESGKIEGYYHSNIRIENNHFRTFDPAVLAATSVDGLSFENNVIEKTSTYEPYRVKGELIYLELCKNVTVSGNKVTGFDGFKLVNERM